MSRFATMITRDYTVPELIAQFRTITSQQNAGDMQGMNPDPVPGVGNGCKVRGRI